MFEIVTDSPANLPEHAIKQHGIHVLNLPVRAGDAEYTAYGNDCKLFCEMMRGGRTLTTSQVSPAAFERVFEGILSRGRGLLYLGFASALSGTYQNAVAVAEALRGRYDAEILTVDTLSASMGQGLLVLRAAEMRAEGRGIDETAAWVRENRLRACHCFTVDDLRTLRRGGRISGAAAAVGTALNIKPVLRMDDGGRLVAAGKARGRRAALDALTDYMAERMDARGRVFVAHADCESDAAYLGSRVRALFGMDAEIVPLSPVLCSHTGPGTAAVFFFGRGR